MSFSFPLSLYLHPKISFQYSTGDRNSYETSSLILTSTSPFSEGYPEGLVIKGYIDCHFYQFRYLYDVYQCFEDEAKKLCANAVFEFSLNPIPMFNTNSNNAQNPGILATGMAVCFPENPPENCTC